MKRYLQLGAAMSLFLLGLAVGRTGWTAGSQQALAGSLDLSSLSSVNSAGGALLWEQNGNLIDFTVVGKDGTFMGDAILSNPDAWPDFGSGESQILDAGASFTLDLTEVDELRFFEMVPVGVLKDGLFRPCNDIPVLCGPVRPPVPPPGEHVHLYAMTN